MAKSKKKGKAGKTVVGAGILAIIAALLGFNPFGWNFGLGAGQGIETGDDDGGVRQEQQTKDSNTQDNPEPTATVTPAEQQKDTTVVQLTEVEVIVNGDKVVYNCQEGTAQAAVDLLVSDYADSTDAILVKVTLEQAIYDTVEALKVALEGKGIKYEIAE